MKLGPAQRLALRVARRGGTVAVMASTGPGVDQVPVGAPVRARGVRVRDMSPAEIAGTVAAAAPVAAPRRPRSVTSRAAVMGGEEMAEALRAELADVAAQRFVRVWFVPPALVIEFANLPPGADPAQLRGASPRLKLAVRRQRAIGGVLEDSPEMTVSASVSQPAGLFRTKTALPGELVGYIARAVRKLAAESPAAPLAAAAGGRRRRPRVSQDLVRFLLRRRLA